jgi:hypothetical protein
MAVAHGVLLHPIDDEITVTSAVTVKPWYDAVTTTDPADNPVPFPDDAPMTKMVESEDPNRSPVVIWLSVPFWYRKTLNWMEPPGTMMFVDGLITM